MSITAKAIAKKLGISETAVSMALHNKPGVSDKTKKLVMDTAIECGYDFNKIKEKNVDHFRIVLIEDLFSAMANKHVNIFNEIKNGIKKICKSEYCYLYIKQLSATDSNDDEINNINFYIREQRANGVLIIGTGMTRDVLMKLCDTVKELSIPCVLIDSFYHKQNISSVTINNREGGYIAADYLLKKYHSQPGYIKSLQRTQNYEERFDGFVEAISNAGIEKNRIVCHQLSVAPNHAMEDMLNIIESGEKIARCYFAENDLLAMGVIKAFEKKGYKVPDDVAVIGFDNSLNGVMGAPRLTSIDYSKYSLGIEAMYRLLLEIRNKNISHTTIQLEVSIKINETA